MSSIPSPGSNNLFNQDNPDGNQSNDQINNQNITADYDQWYTDEQTMQQDEESLAAAIADLVNVSHGHNYNATFEAMMMFFTQVFPDVLNIQQDQLNTLSDSQNISSDLRSFVTSIQNDMNTISQSQLYTNNPTSGNPSWSSRPNWTAAGDGDASFDFYGNTCDLYAWAHFLSSSSSTNGLSANISSPLNVSDANQMEQYSVGIANEIVNPWGTSSYSVTFNVKNNNILNDDQGNLWFTDPASNPTTPSGATSNPFPTPPSGQDYIGFNVAYAIWLSSQTINYNTNPPPAPSGGGNPLSTQPGVWTDNNPIKTIQQNLQEDNSATSSISTTTQTTEQFYTNQYNQLTGIDNSMQQNFVEEISAIIQNESPNG